MTISTWQDWLSIIGFIVTIVLTLPFWVVIIFGGEYTFSSKGAIPQIVSIVRRL